MDCECQWSQVLGWLQHRGVYLLLRVISSDSEAETLPPSAVGNATGQDRTLPVSPPRGLAHPLLHPRCSWG